MDRFFTALYQLLLGVPKPPSLIQVYRQAIFPSVGLYTVLLALAMVLFYYLVLNRVLTTSLFKTRHWLLFLILTALALGGLAYGIGNGQTLQDLEQSGALTDTQEAVRKTYLLEFALVNAVYAALFYVLFSFLIKGLSTSARTTPTSWPQ